MAGKEEERIAKLKRLVTEVTGIEDTDGVVLEASMTPGWIKIDSDNEYSLYILEPAKQEKFVNFILDKLQITEIEGFDPEDESWSRIDGRDYERLCSYYVLKLKNDEQEFYMAPNFSEGALWIESRIVDALD